MKRTTLQMRLRLLLVGLVLFVLLAALVARMFWIQGVQAEAYTKQAAEMWEKHEVLKPQRGTIFDRDGNMLAEEVSAFTIAVYLPTFRKGDLTAEEAATQIAPLLKMGEQEVADRLSRDDVDQVELKTSGFSFKVSKEVKENVMDLDIPGVHAIPATKRLYLNDTLAAHVLGFLNNVGDPVQGTEAIYHDVLDGAPGKASFIKDRSGVKVANGEQTFEPPVNGKDILLTIDRAIQEVVEDVLDEAMQTYTPKSATVIAMNPNNGEILAMVNRPTYNPNAFYEAHKKELVNMATQGAYEPGSTFKIITLASALQEGKFHPNATFRSGSIQVENETIHDWRPEGWGDITYLEGVQRSSNVAFVRLQQALGKTFDTYIERFGFGPYGEERQGTPTGIDLTEARGLLPDPGELSALERATSSYGQGLAVTPIQLVTAVSAALNGGTLYQPHVLKQVLHPETGAVLETKEPVVVRDQIVSDEASRQLRDILHSVVEAEHGTATQTKVPGYEIGGKTGTAIKYNTDRYYVSFLGFSPVDDPQVVLYVALDEPASHDVSGGRTVGPIVRDIFEQILPLLEIKPNLMQTDSRETTTSKHESSKLVQLPDLTNQSVKEAKRALNNHSLNAHMLGSGQKVLAHEPSQGLIERGETVYVLTEKPNTVPMPDLRTMSLREAMAVCNMLELDVQIEGSGYVFAQSIKPGHRLLEQDVITLKLKPN